MHIIEVQNLTKDYGHGRGVFDVSIHVDKGEVFGFLGPNGAGKSTTIRHLMGFSKPDKGSTKIEGYDDSKWNHALINIKFKTNAERKELNPVLEKFDIKEQVVEISKLLESER